MRLFKKFGSLDDKGIYEDETIKHLLINCVFLFVKFYIMVGFEFDEPYFNRR